MKMCIHVFEVFLVIFFFSSRRRHTRCALVTGVQTCALPIWTALDAVEAGARVPEADPENHSVGYGGYPDRDGHVTLDAIIMDEDGRVGAVAALEDVVHAISVARGVMEKTPHTMLVGEGATRFALDQGMERTRLLTPAAEKAW